MNTQLSLWKDKNHLFWKWHKSIFRENWRIQKMYTHFNTNLLFRNLEFIIKVVGFNRWEFRIIIYGLVARYGPQISCQRQVVKSKRSSLYTIQNIKIWTREDVRCCRWHFLKNLKGLWRDSRERDMQGRRLHKYPWDRGVACIIPVHAHTYERTTYPPVGAIHA